MSKDASSVLGTIPEEEIAAIIDAIEKVVKAERDYRVKSEKFLEEQEEKRFFFDKYREEQATKRATESLVNLNASQAALTNSVKEYLVAFGISEDTAGKISSIWNENSKSSGTEADGTLNSFDADLYIDGAMLSGIPADEIEKARNALVVLGVYLNGDEGQDLAKTLKSEDLDGYLSVNENILEEVDRTHMQNEFPNCQGTNLNNTGRSHS